MINMKNLNLKNKIDIYISYFYAKMILKMIYKSDDMIIIGDEL